jgi:hypothetical protein
LITYNHAWLVWMRLNTSESRRHYLNYYKIYILNQHNNLSSILEWQRKFQIISHKNYNLNFNDGFVIFFTSKFTTCSMDNFTFEMKPHLIFYLLNENDYIHWISDFENEVHPIWDLWISNLQKCKGNGFLEIGRNGQQFSVGSEILGAAPARIWHPPQSSCGCLTFSLIISKYI